MSDSNELDTLEILMDDSPSEEGANNESPIGAQEETSTETPVIAGQENQTSEETAEEEVEIPELEVEEPISDEKLEVPTPFFSRKAVLKEYPDLFKKFPNLEQAVYRDRAYGDVFPTVAAAKEAAEKISALDRYQQDVLSGDITSVLGTLKNENPAAYGKLVDNYIGLLERIDPYAHLHVISNLGKQIIYRMGTTAQQLGNNDLKSAAILLNQFLFGNGDYVPPQHFDTGANQPVNTELDQAKQQFLANTYQSVLSEDYDKCKTSIKNTISRHIDPKKSMPDFVKTTAVDKAIGLVERAIQSDSRFKAQLDNLWKDAFNSNFSPASRERIRSAYLAKAKTVLPQSIQSVRNEALKGLGANGRPEKDRQGPLPRGGSPTNNPGKITKPSQIPAGMSTREFLMRDDL